MTGIMQTMVGSSFGGPPVGQQTFTSSGTWTAPAGVTSVCVVCVGGGGGGLQYSTQNYSMSGGGGGGLGWKNNIAVVAGNSYTVVVGAGGSSGGIPLVAPLVEIAILSTTLL